MLSCFVVAHGLRFSYLFNQQFYSRIVYNLNIVSILVATKSAQPLFRHKFVYDKEVTKLYFYPELQTSRFDVRILARIPTVAIFHKVHYLVCKSETFLEYDDVCDQV